MPKSSGFYTESVFTVDNRFTEISLVHPSENGYSEVYKALRHGKWHILKRLTDQESDNPRYQQLLQKEFEISYPLSHPGIVHTLGMEEVEGMGVCIIQEYIDGTTWDEFFQKKVKRAERRRILSELCLAIDYIHQRQIVHRDLTPKNILITRDGHHPRILDFGLADRDVFVYLKEPAGTTGFASPEQQKPGLLDNRSDIYSLGVLIDGITSATDLHLRRMARKCMANNPDKRYVSAIEIHRMLEPVKWGRWFFSVAFVILAAMAFMWYFSDSNQTQTIAKLKQQSLQQQQQSQILQQQIKAQQEHIADMKEDVGQMSSAVDSVQAANKEFSQRIDKEDSHAAAMSKAKKELHAIADEQYQKIWDSHSELADQPKKRRSTTNYEIYLVDWHPIVTRLVKKYNLDATANKILMDEWLVAVYNKVK